jgi:phosphatidylglycerophosphate synthase
MRRLKSAARDVTERLVTLNRTVFGKAAEPLAKRLESHTDSIIVRNVPNGISVLRCVLAVLVDWQIYHATSDAAKWGWICVIVVLIISDGFDGSLARRLNIVSRFGALADPFADKVLVGGLVIGLGFKFDTLWFWIPMLVLLSIEFLNALAGPVGGYLADKVGHPEKVGASIWGKVKFGSECILVILGWALLSSKVALPLSVTLAFLTIPLAGFSLGGYAGKIVRASKMLAAQSAHQLVE